MRRTARRGLLAALSILPFLLLALPAGAQVVEEVAEQVDFRGYYVEPGLDLSIELMERLVDGSPSIGFVAVDEAPEGGADVFADEILSRVGQRDTVIVLAREEAGAASAVLQDDALERAFDQAFASPGDTYEEDFSQLAEALAGVPATTSAQPASDGGGPGIGWLLVLGVVGVTGFFLWRSSRIEQKAVGRRLGQAREEIEQQMAVVANQILESSDRVEGSGQPEVVEHFRKATETYRSAERRLATSTTWRDLEELSDDLDAARWELAAAAALLEGREPPPRPTEDAPEPCFFDPTHGAGVEVAELSTPAGSRNVLVCQEDAERLRRGERPEPRSISVGGKGVPAPQAPRSHGGRGFDWLDAFSIMVGGMHGPMGYRWGRARRRGGFGLPFPGGFGGGFGGVGSSRTRGTARGRRSGGSRAVGRARRGR